MEANAQTCNNIPSWLLNGKIGIQTNNPYKPLHIGAIPQTCGDPAIRLSYDDQPVYLGHLVLQTPDNPFYSMISTEKDLILHGDESAEDIILTTRNNNGHIRFATTPAPMAPNIERMTITPEGNVGLWETNPRELLQIGSRLTFHVGAGYDFIGYNEYNDANNDRRRFRNDVASCLNFDVNGNIRLVTTNYGVAESLVSYDEATGGLRGIAIYQKHYAFRHFLFR